jgi:purine-nucleoside phosphorylase
MCANTAQNTAKKGDYAKTVIMPGDPHRSRFIAENFIEGARLVNDVRSAQGYTGTYKGEQVSVMSHGMGCPSMGIYAFELFNMYGVEHIIRVGSAGAIQEDLKVRDVVIAIGACTSSNFFNAQYPQLAGSYAPTPSYRLLETAVNVSRELDKNVRVGNVFTSDHFYDASRSAVKWGELGCLAVEMEIAALYFTAHQAGKEALGICTISDHVLTGEELNSIDRERTFTDMMEIAMETAIRL